MIEIVGTSHISSELVNEIENIINRENPDLIALELDESRLYALLRGERRSNFSFIINFLSLIQNYFGRKTGIFPGEEMLRAFEIAQKKQIPIALIDREIEITLKKFNSIPLIEKMKLFFFLPLIFIPFPRGIKFDIRKVPPKDLVDYAMKELNKRFPNLYRILVEERDIYMAGNLMNLYNDYEKILAFVGAGHVRGIKKILEEKGFEVNIL